ncbi:MAG: hypothetical protein ACI97A_001472 [Planctomycetota bacterium]|jgi:hypothetical protein
MSEDDRNTTPADRDSAKTAHENPKPHKMRPTERNREIMAAADLKRHKNIAWIFEWAWFFLMLTRFVFWHEIYEELFICALLLDAVLLITGVMLLVHKLVPLRRAREHAFQILAILLILWSYFSWGPLIGTAFKLKRNEAHYQATVDSILKTNDYAVDSPTIWVDKGPPVRIAFPWGGITDNWFGIVYDPTGEVLKANQIEIGGENWHNPKFEPVKKLFGGDMHAAQHMWGHWYYCVFT